MNDTSKSQKTLNENFKFLETLGFEPINTRAGVLQRLIKIIDAKRYLEIGVNQGATFKAIENIDYKVAVDPKFLYDYANDEIPGKVEHYEVPSDLYFSQFCSHGQYYDLIYIDGLHSFEQSLKDLMNSLSHLRKSGLILIDDTSPKNPAQAHRKQGAAAKYRSFFKDTSKSWMGDVFKTVYFVNDFLLNYSFATFPNHGQTLLYPKKRNNATPIFGDLAKISRMCFMDFLETKDLVMNVSSYNQIFNEVQQCSNQALRSEDPL